MSFVLECLYCKYPGKVPADALHCGLRCPQCAGSFMLVPKRMPVRMTMLAPAAAPSEIFADAEDVQPAAPDTSLDPGKVKKSKRRSRETRLAPPVEPANPLPYFNEPLDLANEAEGRPSLAMETSPSLPPVARNRQTFPSPDDDEEISPRPPVSLVVGAAALLLGVAALLSASAFGWYILVFPLSALGFCVGLGALIRAWADGQSPRLPSAGAAVSGVILLAALLAPGLFGIDYQAHRQLTEEDPTAIKVVLLPGQKQADDVTNPDWIDASRAGLRQGSLNLRVASAELAAGDSSVFRKPDKDGKKKYLVLRLRIQRAASGREFGDKEWGEPAAGDDAPRLRLTDAAGKVYPQLDLDLKAGSSSQTLASGAFPVSLANPGFVFEAPEPDVESLRLEVPAAPWGGVGYFRFTLPKSMLRTEPAFSHPLLDPRLVPGHEIKKGPLSK